MARRGPRPIHVLLVEDNLGDARLVQEAFRAGGRPVQVHLARGGPEALAFLRGESHSGEGSFPDLVLLDLNLPRASGLDVLREVRSHPDWHWLPVLILTSSQAESDIRECYALNATGYLVKPSEWTGFLKMVRALEAFWFDFAQLPGR